MAEMRMLRIREGKLAGDPSAGLPPLPHKYGFSRAVYDPKRVESVESEPRLNY